MCNIPIKGIEYKGKTQVNRKGTINTYFRRVCILVSYLREVCGFSKTFLKISKDSGFRHVFTMYSSLGREGCM